MANILRLEMVAVMGFADVMVAAEVTTMVYDLAEEENTISNWLYEQGYVTYTGDEKCPVPVVAEPVKEDCALQLWYKYEHLYLQYDEDQDQTYIVVNGVIWFDQEAVEE